MSKEQSFERIVPENIFDSGNLKVLICYMLASLGEGLPVTELSQLFHYEGLANYFDTQTAIYQLEQSGHVAPSDNDMIVITEKGAELSRELRDRISVVLRGKVYDAVVKMLARYKAERDTDIKLEQMQSGCMLTYTVRGAAEPLLSFSLMLPNQAQANALKERILIDPKYYCDKFIELLTEDIEKKQTED